MSLAMASIPKPPSSSAPTTTRASPRIKLVTTTKAKLVERPLSEIERLELENRKMEERLKALKLSAAAERERRSSKGFVWRSADPTRGSVSRYAEDVMQSKATTKPSNISKELMKRRVKGYLGTGTEATSLLHSRVTASDPGLNKPAISVPTWRVPTALAHREPVEHAKRSPSPDAAQGAKAEYQFDRLIDGAFDEDASHASFLEALREWRGESKSDNPVETPKPVQQPTQTQGLMDGDYDEAASHASFLEALKQWRGESKTTTRARPESSSGSQTSFQVQTDSSNANKPKSAESVNITFSKSGLSYADKLLLQALKERKLNEESGGGGRVAGEGYENVTAHADVVQNTEEMPSVMDAETSSSVENAAPQQQEGVLAKLAEETQTLATISVIDIQVRNASPSEISASNHVITASSVIEPDD